MVRSKLLIAVAGTVVSAMSPNTHLGAHNYIPCVAVRQREHRDAAKQNSDTFFSVVTFMSLVTVFLIAMTRELQVATAAKASSTIGGWTKFHFDPLENAIRHVKLLGAGKHGEAYKIDTDEDSYVLKVYKIDCEVTDVNQNLIPEFLNELQIMVHLFDDEYATTIKSFYPGDNCVRAEHIPKITKFSISESPAEIFHHLDDQKETWQRWIRGEPKLKHSLEFPCILMNFVGDDTFEGWFERRRKRMPKATQEHAKRMQSPAAILEIVKVLLTPYEALHKRNVTHTDVKMGNMLIVYDKTAHIPNDSTSRAAHKLISAPKKVYLTDFGISRARPSRWPPEQDLFKLVVRVIIGRLINVRLPHVVESYNVFNCSEQLDFDYLIDANGQPYSDKQKDEMTMENKISVLLENGWRLRPNGHVHGGIAKLDPSDPVSTSRLIFALTKMISGSATAGEILQSLS